KGGLGGRRDAKGIAAAPALDGSVLMYGTEGGEIVTLDLDSGKELKRFKVAGEAVHVPLILAKGVLYGAAGKTLFACDPKAGKVLWTYAGEERFQPPIVADKAVYVAAGRTFYCLR
ncbi:MAG: PQQ-binding-like beta-propeller repeat protein, partial [Planctomycetota bacterium]